MGLGGTNNFEYHRAATGQILSKRDAEIKTSINLKLSTLIRGELLLKGNGIDMTSTKTWMQLKLMKQNPRNPRVSRKNPMDFSYFKNKAWDVKLEGLLLRGFKPKIDYWLYLSSNGKQDWICCVKSDNCRMYQSAVDLFSKQRWWQEKDKFDTRFPCFQWPFILTDPLT